MGLIIENISGVQLSINDLGIGLESGTSVDLAVYSDPVNVAGSAQAGGDLNAAITAAGIVVKDPLDNVTNLSIADGLAACASHNDTHWRMPAGGRIADALDVSVPGVATDEVLQFNGTSWVNVDPSSIGGSGSFQLSWRFDTSTTASNPGSKKYRFDTVTTAAISEIYINDISESGVDASVLLSVLKAGDKIYVQQTDDASTAFLFTVTAAATDNIGWFTIPVSVDSEVGFLPGNNKVCSWVLMYGLGAGSSQNLWEKIVADNGFIVAATPTDTFGIAGGTAIDTTVSVVTNTITIDLDETVINHANILNIGTNSHAQLDTHVSDATIHFTEGSIDHENILNIGTNSHADIDTHISDATIHFTEASIDHENILNIGTNSHADIDTHISDATIHFTEASIDHTVISNIGTNSHANIDTHIADGTIHFTEGSISHLNIGDIGTNTHADIDTHIGDATIHFTEGSISHLNIGDIGTNTHADIDTHIADGTIHFTEGSIDHTAITNIGTNSHADIDTHIADGTIHFTEGSIDHTAITNIGTNSHADIDTHIADTANPHDTSVSNLDDTTITAPADDDVLIYDAGGWVNVSALDLPPPAGITYYSHNGGVTQAIGTTFVTNLFGTNVRTDGIYSYNAGEVTVSTAGDYILEYNVTCNATGGTRRQSECKFQVDGADVVGSIARGYHRNTLTGSNTAVATISVTLGAGAVVRVQTHTTGGAVETLANACRLKITKG